MRIPTGSTDRYPYFLAVDATDLKTRETGLSSFTVHRSRNGAADVAMTTPTVTEIDATNMPGVYALLLDEDTTLTAGNDSEEMVFHITVSGMAPVTRTVEIYRPETTEGNTLDVTANGEGGIDLDNVNGTLSGGELAVGAFASGAITAAAIAASALDGKGDWSTHSAANVWTSGTRTLTALGFTLGAGDLAADTIGASELAADAVTEIRDAVTGGAYALDTDANGRVRIVDGTGAGELDTASGQVTVATNNDKTGYSISGTKTTLDALNDVSTAQVNAEVDTALADIHLDHLLAVDYDPASKPGVATALLNELIENDGGVSRYTANALEQGPSGGGGGGDATAANQTTIINHLTDIKGAGWNSTDTLEEILNDVTGLNGEAMRGTDSAYTGTPPAASAIADAVWDEATAGHTTAGTFGKAIGDGVTAWVTATGFSTHAAADIWTAGTRTLTSGVNLNDLSQADVRTAVGLATANLDTQLAALAGYIDTEVAQIISDIAALADPTAAEIADAVWDEAIAGHTGAGSTGEALNGATAPSAAAVADAVWDEAIADHLGAGSTGQSLNAAGGSGDPWITALPGSYTAGQAGHILGNMSSLAGAGSISWEVEVLVSAVPVAGAKVWVSTDAAGVLVAAGTLITDDFGKVTFLLDAGTYYLWRDHPNYTFENPQTMVVS